MNSWKTIVGDDDPFMQHLSENARDTLEKASDELQEF
jgi:hypothetical protein